MLIEQVETNVYVLRDDKILGGTKKAILDEVMDPKYESYVYASPCEGAFQVALSIWCSENNKECHIFTPKRKETHMHTELVRINKGIIHEVSFGRLTNLQYQARLFSESNNFHYIKFGYGSDEAIDEISRRCVTAVINCDRMPTHIYCAFGSGTLYQGISQACASYFPEIKVVGIDVKPLQKKCDYPCPFPCNINYDLKAWKRCYSASLTNPENIYLFWNVSG